MSNPSHRPAKIYSAEQQALIDSVSAADLDYRATKEASFLETAEATRMAQERARRLRAESADAISAAKEKGRASVALAYRARDLSIRAAIDAGVLRFELASKEQGIHTEDYGVIRAALARTEAEALASATV